MSEQTDEIDVNRSEAAEAALEGPEVPVPAVKNPRIRYTLVYPDGTRVSRGGVIVGWVSDLRAQEDQLLHGLPILTQVENLRTVGLLGRPIPDNQQPPLFQLWNRHKSAVRKAAGYDPARRGAAPATGDHHRALMALAMDRPHLRELIEANGGETRGLPHPGVQPPPGEGAPAGVVYTDEDLKRFADPLRKFDGGKWTHPDLPDPRDAKEPVGAVDQQAALNVKPAKKK